VCSTDGGTVCAQTTGYGFELDPETGDDRHYTNTYYVYALGGWDDIIEFRKDVTDGGGSCEVYVNGELCDYRTLLGFNGFSVDCSNLAPQLTFRSCFPDLGQPNALDVFKYLDARFVNDTTCQPIFPYK
jgi:hypothetical protein